MDRFKFRVWYNSPFTNIPSGYLYYDPKEDNHLTDIIRDADCDRAADIIYYDLRDIILGNIDEYDSGHFVVEQCTGLKDKNGNLIYEGDRVIKKDRNALGYGPTCQCRVHWRDDYAGWALTTEWGDTYPLAQFTSDQLEIIGNVHTKEYYNEHK